MEIAQKKKYYREIIEKLDKFLISIQKDDGTYPGKTNYGYTFSALFWSYCGIREHSKYIERALGAYFRQDKNYFDYPWEFNNYALLKLKEKAPFLALSVPWWCNKGTKVTNWRILRIINAYRATKKKYYLLKLIPTLFRKISKDGLIIDERSLRSCSRSFQYHTFSTALLGELFVLSKIKIIGKLFLKATFFITDKIMRNGRALYLGRGQEQIFGYSALLYCLELAYKLTHIREFNKKVLDVLSLLRTFQRKNGSFPLVLNEEEFKEGLLSSNERPLGWYSYNTPFDYLPFTGVYLYESFELYKAKDARPILDLSKINKEIKKIKEKKKEIIKESCDTYEYCYALPTGGKGYYSDEMPFPFIVTKDGREITPIYGGDPIWVKDYTPSSIPLPWGIIEQKFIEKHKLFKWCFFLNIKLSHWGYRNYYQNNRNNNVPYFFANQLKYQTTPSGFIGKNPWIWHERDFHFDKDKIKIVDIIKLKRVINFLSFYPVNLFLFSCKIEKDKNKLKLLNSNELNFHIKVKGIQNKIIVSKQKSPLGSLIWVKEDIKILNKDTIKREIEITW